MADIGAVFKSEINRVAHKVLRAELRSLKHAHSEQRAINAALRRRILALEQQMRAMGKHMKMSIPSKPAAGEEAAQDLDALQRFREELSAEKLVQNRERLGISRAECAHIIGADYQAVLRWETHGTKPRMKFIPAIAALFQMGKRQARAKLAEAIEA